MLRKIFYISAIAIFIVSCARVPITGRKQMKLLPDSEVMAMSFQQYSDFLETNKTISTGSNAAMVQNVGTRLSQSVKQVLKAKGLEKNIEGFKWEFHLVDNPEPNAWCMPGGKVVVYTGILKYTKNEVGLAVVLGHEVAHAVAKHGNERMSQELLASTGYMALDLALSNKPAETRALLMTAVGAGATVGILLPYSRLHESEADRLGLIFMAAAGYNPEEAVAFWQRMSTGGPEIPEFLSTHPSDETRIENIQTVYMPEALGYYKPAK